MVTHFFGECTDPLVWNRLTILRAIRQRLGAQLICGPGYTVASEKTELEVDTTTYLARIEISVTFFAARWKRGIFIPVANSATSEQ